MATSLGSYEGAVRVYSIQCRQDFCSTQSCTHILPGHLVRNIIEGRLLRVHLFNTSQIPPSPLLCNCADFRGPCLREELVKIYCITHTTASLPTPFSSPFPPHSSQHAVSGYAPTAMQQQIPTFHSGMVCAPSVASLYTSQIIPVVQYGVLMDCSPTEWGRAATGFETVNMSRGGVKTEDRAVFISDLPYKFSERSLLHIFEKAGKIVRYDIMSDKQRPGYKRGIATIEYETAKEAHKALKFHGTTFGNRTLNVRVDKESTVTGVVGPGEAIIVDGSTPNY
jgi:hypothetical protein